jgi:FkbM family methyltransferase
VTLTAELAHAWDRLSGAEARRQRAAKAAFRAALAGLKPGDIAIDLGANAGEFTTAMAATGAEVHAFEPDPHAFSLLRKAVAGRQNVHLIPAAAGDRAGTATLYRSTSFDRAPDRRSKSSSLFVEKRNVGSDNAVEIEVRDFVAFLRALTGRVGLVKIDIEGGEVPVMEALLNSDQAARIDAIFIETHERGLPVLAARTAALKARTAGLERPRVNWDWH